VDVESACVDIRPSLKMDLLVIIIIIIINIIFTLGRLSMFQREFKNWKYKMQVGTTRVAAP